MKPIFANAQCLLQSTNTLHTIAPGQQHCHILPKNNNWPPIPGVQCPMTAFVQKFIGACSHWRVRCMHRARHTLSITHMVQEHPTPPWEGGCGKGICTLCCAPPPCQPGVQAPDGKLFYGTLLTHITNDSRLTQLTSQKTIINPPCVTFRLVVAPLRGPGRSPVLPFACCVGSLLSVGRCGRCSCWCRFRVRGAQ